MEDETGQHVMTFSIHVIILFLNVEFSEEIESDDRVNVHNDSQKHDSQQ